MKKVVWSSLGLVLLATVSGLSMLLPGRAYAAVENPQSGSVGVQGTLSAPAPTKGATISIPRNGQTFDKLPITVSGICPKGLLVKLFKNNVFAGSQQCENGSFSMQIDLFVGKNELIARVYDDLDQAGPDSNKVTVSFNDNRQGAASRPTLTSNFAKRGANPGQKLTWPIIISGGSSPYAVSIDWGDGKAPDLKSVASPGTFDIEHTYDNPGVYNIIVKATDANGNSAYLQLVGIANGALSQDQGNDGGSTNSGRTVTKILWQPAAFAIPLIITTFWLGKKHELKMLRKKIEQGKNPF